MSHTRPSQKSAIVNHKLKLVVTWLLLLAIAAFTLAPFVWMVLVSLHPNRSPIPPLSEVVPKQPAWRNYTLVLFGQPTLPVFRFFLNSLFVTSAVVAGQLFISSLAAYGFARLKFRGREPLFYLFLGSMMFSGPATVLPVYLLMRQFGWLDTYWALIVPGVSSSFSVFLFRQAFFAVPMELDEAARLDGASEFLIYRRVVVPLSKAAFATAGAFGFFAVWTDFFWPMLSTSRAEMRTLEVGLSVFKNSFGATNWPLQMTAAVIVMVPLLIVFLFTQRYFVKGISIGSIK